MAITLQCPRCEHEQKIDESKAGQEVPCKICHHLIKAGAAPPTPSAKPAPQAKKASPAAVQAGMPTSQPAKATATDKNSKSENVATDTPRSRSSAKKNDPDDDRPAPRIRRDKEKSTGMLSIAIAGGVVLLVLFMCGGLSLGGYFFFAASPRADEPIAHQDHADGQQHENEVRPPRNPNPPNQDPPAKQNPFPQNPIPNPPPVQENLDAGNPKHLDRVLAILNGPAQERGPGFHWLDKADPNHPRRAEVAQLLDGLVVEYLANPPGLGNDGLFNPYFKWITKDNVPTLIRVADSTRFTVWDNKYRQEAMRALGKFKDPRGVETIVKKLGNTFDGGVAFEALMEMGPVAEPAIAPLLNDTSFPGSRRDSARKLLKAYNTRSDLLFDQCIKDLASPDGNQRSAALQWIAQAEFNDRRKADVSLALNRSIENEGSFRNRDLAVCLEKYGTSENTKKLIQILDANRLGGHETLRALGKLRDKDGVKAIAGHLANFFNRDVAQAVLKDCGELAEPAVIEVMTTTANPGCRIDCAKLLGEIGTSKLSVPALRKVGQFFAQDGQLGMAVQQSIKAITARGK